MTKTVLSQFRQAKSVSYGGTRSLSSIYYIPIHNTGNIGDTAKNNVDYFATGNTRSAGAHIFISRSGDAWSSIPLEYVAWSVGDSKNGHGTYYGKCTNANSVSIELADIVDKDPSEAQINKCIEVIRWIQSKCPNAKTVIRHYDVTTKSCPQRYVTTNRWSQLRAALTAGASVGATDVTPNVLAVDGYAGQMTIGKWQKVMGTVCDGVISGQIIGLKKYHLNFVNGSIDYGKGGSSLIKAVQAQLGCTADGYLGPDTIKAIQTHLGVYADGYAGRKTITALQERLNEGRF